MNGFDLLADSYRRELIHGTVDPEKTLKYIRIFDFFAKCDNDDFYMMVDSSAFNAIIRGYVKMAVRNAGFDIVQENEVVSQLYALFDGKKAKDVMEAV
jgi:hypothetical protein